MFDGNGAWKEEERGREKRSGKRIREATGGDAFRGNTRTHPEHEG